MTTARTAVAVTGGRRGSVRRDTKTGRWMFVVDAATPGSTERRQVRRRGFATQRERGWR